MTSPTEKSKDCLWVQSINAGRKGAAYFLELKNVLTAHPAGYFENRDMDADNQKAIVHEWKQWMTTFRGSKHKVLTDLAQIQHEVEMAVTQHLLRKVLVARKLDMMETSKAQLRDNETEMTHLLKNALPVGKSLLAPVPSSDKGKRRMKRSVHMDDQDPASSLASSSQDSLDLPEPAAVGENDLLSSRFTKRSRLEYRVEEEQEDQQEDEEGQPEQDEQEDQDEETDREQLNKFELEELRANLAEVTHNECDHHINGDLDDASVALHPLPRKLRIMIESLMDKLPHKADKTLAEGTFVANCVSPIIHGILGIDNKIITIHFPNTESKLQKGQGIKADRPDVVVKVRGHEVLFGEVTGPTKANDTSKCNWDLFRLARFAKSFLEEGYDVAPVIQVIYTSGSYLRLHVKARSMFLLEEVGYFEVPSCIARIPSLVATISTLLVAQ
ncbi:hypothetical protein BGW38_005105, partial [Lunasporangiospora selenospora]